MTASVQLVPTLSCWGRYGYDQCADCTRRTEPTAPDFPEVHVLMPRMWEDSFQGVKALVCLDRRFDGAVARDASVGGLGSGVCTSGHAASVGPDQGSGQPLQVGPLGHMSMCGGERTAAS